MARRAVRLGDLASPDTLAEKLAAMVAHHNVWLAAVGHALADADQMFADLMAMRDELLAFSGQSWQLLADVVQEEGASAARTEMLSPMGAASWRVDIESCVAAGRTPAAMSGRSLR